MITSAAIALTAIGLMAWGAAAAIFTDMGAAVQAARLAPSDMRLWMVAMGLVLASVGLHAGALALMAHG